MPTGDDWLHEIKFDGYRMLAHIRDGSARFYSRNRHDWTDRFPELAGLLPKLPVTEAILDGEIVHMLETGVTSFGRLQADIGDKRTAGLFFVVFDLLYLDGWRLERVRLDKRKALLASVLADPPDTRIRYSDHQVGRGPEFFAAAAAIPLEGIVSKRRDSTYRGGRRADWLKIKAVGREELVVVGFTDPAGERIGFGSLLVGYYTPAGTLNYAGGVGTGYSDKVLRTLRARLDTIAQKEATVMLPKSVSRTGVHWVRPEMVVEVRFTEWTSDGILRHPVFLGVREDKTAREVVLDRTVNPDAKTTRWNRARRSRTGWQPALVAKR